MVLERIVKISTLEGRPWELMLLGFVWTGFSCGLALFLFPGMASLLSVTFIVMLTLPFVFRMLADEERHYDASISEAGLLKYHGHTFMCFLFLFFGILAGFVAWFAFAPADVVHILFQAQTDTITGINSPTGAFSASGTLWRIFWHNTKILLVSIFLAFFLGSGPIFVLAWNASVIAAAIGTLIRSQFLFLQGPGASLLWSEKVQAMLFPFFRYLGHGIPEILGYIVGGLAGGLVSVAVIRRHWGKEHVVRTLGDASTLLALAVFLLFVAAAIEVKILASL